MKVQAMSSAIRSTLTLREVRALHQLAKAGAQALGIAAPDCARDLVAKLEIGIAELEWKQADARSRRTAKLARPLFKPMINLTINGLKISAEKGDWIDINPMPDSPVWGELTPERESLQAEIRRDAWRVLVLTPMPYDSLCIASDCTKTGDAKEVEPLARRLVAGLNPNLVPN